MIQKKSIINFAIIQIMIVSFFTLSCKNNTQANDSTSIKKTISVADYDKLLNSSGEINLIDVRTSEEYNEGHLEKAINININGADFETEIAKLDKNKVTFVYCLAGSRSATAMDKLSSTGFKTVYNMQGGIMAWRQAGKPIATMTPETAQTSAAKGMTIDEFNKLVSTDQYVLVDFNAVWCGPCKTLGPILDKIAASKKSKLKLIKIDVDQNPTIADSKQITSIPYMELYHQGKLVWKHVGLLDEQTILIETKL